MKHKRPATIPTPGKLLRIGWIYRHWYDVATSHLSLIARTLEVSPTRFIELISLFSPRKSVLRNLRVTTHYILTGSFSPDVTRSVRNSIHHYESTGEIRGPKTRRFASALLDSPTSVPVDVWTLRAFGFPSDHTATERTHHLIYRKIRRLATRFRISPRDAQAAIWCGYLLYRGYRVRHYHPDFPYFPNTRNP